MKGQTRCGAAGPAREPVAANFRAPTYVVPVAVVRLLRVIREHLPTTEYERCV
ncbi:hypothetical protein F4561_004823 [Lipingzhangella halophila]|uniref:Uncharacterized protein n=1 Tax=Lipingzhangella halophila TaxID=1783352 RepID=A0A7W7W4V7_9ACTN|nr:hypothetical protein [Lipingzhangella halophila]